MTNNNYKLYGAEFSLYSGKARSYLRYKRIPYGEVLSSLRVYKKIIIPNTGVRFVPVVQTPSGEFLQDTSHIIDTLEGEFKNRPVIPATPCQRLASLLLELYGDEWLLLPAMHYRWNHDNFPFIFEEFGRTMLPHWPRFVQRIIGKRIGSRFQGLLPVLGISEHNKSAIEEWYEGDFLPALDAHFAEHDFLLGNTPTLGDFGFFGPLYAHLCRDPYPARLMREQAPNVVAWVERMQDAGDVRGNSDLLPDDKVPSTLTPIFQRMFAEHWPVLIGIANRLQQWGEENEGPRVPRNIGEQSFAIGGVSDTRAVLPYSIWKMQRSLDSYRALNDDERQQADEFLHTVGGYQALQFQIPQRLTRKSNRLTLVSSDNARVA